MMTLRNDNSIIPESDLSFDSTAAPEKQLRSLLCACVSNTTVKPKFCVILADIIKSSSLSCRRTLVSLLCSFVLTACDDLKLGKDVLPANSMEDSSFFYPLKDNNLTLTQEKSIYVPVYSEIFVAGGGKLNLAITLSIRNTDFEYPLVVKTVNYYNTAGKLIENYLPVPYLLEPMASTHFFVSQTDARGGAGANFIVNWAENSKANSPVIEAVMAGSTGTQGMSFTSSGREINKSQRVPLVSKSE
ncbi:DUF3124 domain-containing protein [Methyloprofundus sp.]|uniref:DUF3124 domain-containing protein n=1 Tax=Methyloprofundus sp. TaxID=2020875 RepID=UPI003D09DF93